MGSDLNITKHLQDYILKNGLKLHPIQKEIIGFRLCFLRAVWGRLLLKLIKMIQKLKLCMNVKILKTQNLK